MIQSEKIPLPTFRSNSGNREVIWRLPVYARLFNIVTNPSYAGAFVYGRRTRRTKVVDGRARRVWAAIKSAEECDVFIRDHHDGYITWAEFIDIQARIRDNAAMQGRMGKTGSGAAKSGKGLLSGLLRCGKCGRSLNTKYGGGRSNPRYECLGEQGRYSGKKCLSLGGATMDRAVSAELLNAIRPWVLRPHCTLGIVVKALIGRNSKRLRWHSRKLAMKLLEFSGNMTRPIQRIGWLPANWSADGMRLCRKLLVLKRG